MSDRQPQDLAFRLAFHRVRRLGSVRFALLERGFCSFEEAWRAPIGDLTAAGLDERSALAVELARGEIDPAEELERLDSLGAHALVFGHDGYPSWLREVDDAPPLLYVRGGWTGADETGIAVVGTRRVTRYGRQATSELAGGMAAAGVTVVSGLARGVDTVAHRSALEAGGRSVAVIAAGIDEIYPPENGRLAEEIAERGAILTDYPPGTRPRPEFFPRRNRILAGLTVGTLVVEGDVTSGAMITARLAADQGREVFAVPGPIFSVQSRGPNTLIREGATPVIGLEHLLEPLNVAVPGSQLDFGHAVPLESPRDRAVLDALSREPRHVDDLTRRTGLAAETVSATLAVLELRGLARDTGGLHYIRIRETVARYRVTDPPALRPARE